MVYDEELKDLVLSDNIEKPCKSNYQKKKIEGNRNCLPIEKKYNYLNMKKINRKIQILKIHFINTKMLDFQKIMSKRYLILNKIMSSLILNNNKQKKMKNCRKNWCLLGININLKKQILNISFQIKNIKKKK